MNRTWTQIEPAAHIDCIQVELFLHFLTFLGTIVLLMYLCRYTDFFNVRCKETEGMISFFCLAIFLHATKGNQDSYLNPWRFNVHLGLTVRTMKTAHKTDCWVCTHFPEHAEKRDPLDWDPDSAKYFLEKSVEWYRPKWSILD